MSYYDDRIDNHPDDPNGVWDYDSSPDPDEYWRQDGNFDRYDNDYDDWLNSQYEEHGYGY
ncbi:MAG: hypothetical protein J6K15_04350 [Lachnospiraceae bacterium]|nr:hypothetical protein [Lachnospiraceae bacterium]